VNIVAHDTVAFDGVSSFGFSSGAFTTVRETGVGNGGDINITTGTLGVSNGAVVSARTRGHGNGGNIIVRANTLEAVNGGQILTTSDFSGEAGDIILNVTQNVTLSGSDLTYSARLAQFGFVGIDNVGSVSGVFTNTLNTSTNRGGDLTINTGQLNVRDGAEVSVSSTGSGIAGSLIVEADAIRLDNQGKIRADTSGGGGNINLSTDDLILRRGSSISTNATGTNITGGNITIDTDNLVAVPQEDSDISANAENSFGGRVIVNVSGIFGTEFRLQDTPLSDITASSALGAQFNGLVELNTPDIDPSRGLANLPIEVVDASNQIDQTCSARGAQAGKNEFIVTGRGGLPPNPSDPLTPNAVWIDLDSTTQHAQNRPSASVAMQPSNSKPVQLVEAQGWVINDKGKVVLTASAPIVTPHSPGLALAQCHIP
jgi:large exoprotein involved in heme utilization and adhesion